MITAENGDIKRDLTMKDDYVTLKTAILLKERGFDWPCRASYVESFDGTFDLMLTSMPCFNHNTDTDIAAPSLAVAAKWLRETFRIDICVSRSFSVMLGYHYQIVIGGNYSNEIVQPVCDGRSYEQSLQDAIAYALDKNNN